MTPIIQPVVGVFVEVTLQVSDRQEVVVAPLDLFVSQLDVGVARALVRRSSCFAHQRGWVKILWQVRNKTMDAKLLGGVPSYVCHRHTYDSVIRITPLIQHV